MIWSRPRLRFAAQVVCIAGLVLAVLLIAVGLAGLRGRGTVGLLDTALLGALPAAVVIFVALLLTGMGRPEWRRSSLRVRRPYSYAVIAAFVLALVTMVVSVTGERSAGGKTTTCHGGGYCRYVSPDSRLVPITTTAYLEDQAGGAVFGGGWAVAVETMALAALQGAVEVRPRRSKRLF